MQGSQNLMSQSRPQSEQSAARQPLDDLAVHIKTILSGMEICCHRLPCPSIIICDLACLTVPVPHSHILCQCQKNASNTSKSFSSPPLLSTRHKYLEFRFRQRRSLKYPPKKTPFSISHCLVIPTCPPPVTGLDYLFICLAPQLTLPSCVRQENSGNNTFTYLTSSVNK